jgi:hypothetical protein
MWFLFFLILYYIKWKMKIKTNNCYILLFLVWTFAVLSIDSRKNIQNFYSLSFSSSLLHSLLYYRCFGADIANRFIRTHHYQQVFPFKKWMNRSVENRGERAVYIFIKISLQSFFGLLLNYKANAKQFLVEDRLSRSCFYLAIQTTSNYNIIGFQCEMCFC